MLLKNGEKKMRKPSTPKLSIINYCVVSFLIHFFSSLRASIKHTKFLFDVVVFYPNTLIAN